MGDPAVQLEPGSENVLSTFRRVYSGGEVGAVGGGALGHADPALTLRVYAHVLPEEEADLSFLHFERGGTGRPFCEAAPRVKRLIAFRRSDSLLLAA